MAPTDPSARRSADAPPQLTLAMRIAERNRLRAQRAERLARLRPAAPGEGAAPAAMAAESEPPPPPRSRATPRRRRARRRSDAAQDALEHFLRALTGGLAGVNPAPPAAGGAALPAPRARRPRRPPPTSIVCPAPVPA